MITSKYLCFCVFIVLVVGFVVVICLASSVVRLLLLPHSSCHFNVTAISFVYFFVLFVVFIIVIHFCCCLAEFYLVHIVFYTRLQSRFPHRPLPFPLSPAPWTVCIISADVVASLLCFFASLTLCKFSKFCSFLSGVFFFLLLFHFWNFQRLRFVIFVIQLNSSLFLLCFRIPKKKRSVRKS